MSSAITIVRPNFFKQDLKAKKSDLMKMGYDFVAVGGGMPLIARRSEALLAEIIDA